MAAFEYIALDASGKNQKGVLAGDSAKAVRAQLRDRGLTPLEVSEVKERPTNPTMSDHRWLERGWSGAQLSIFTRQFATLVRAGLPLDEVLSALAEQSENERAKKMLVAIRSRMLEGASLSQALAEFPRSFDPLYCASIAAGEQSGHLDTVLERLANYCENSAGVAQKITLAMIYPALLALVAIGIVTTLLAVVVPQVSAVFVQFDRQLPWLTRSLLALSDLLQRYGFWLAVLFAGGLLFFVLALRQEAFRSRWQQLLLRVPLLGKLIRDAQAARFARTMAISGAASVPVLDALRISRQVVTLLPMREALLRVHAKVREGSSLAAALKETGQFPPLLVRLTASGEKSGQLDQMLDHAAELQERQVQANLSTFVGLLEPGMILLMGAVVLAIVLAILQPIFDMNAILGNS
jgi:general secretion pathway protein F